MAQPFIGEIRLWAGNFAPADWATCDGQLLAISDYETLFNLIGTTYGGDGQNTFALPNLTARVPIHFGGNGISTYTIAEIGGVTSVTLNLNQLPSHSHAIVADLDSATSGSPSNAYPADATPNALFTVPNSTDNPDSPVLRTLNAAMLAYTGGNEPHDNLQPYLALTYIISLFGNYPSPN